MARPKRRRIPRRSRPRRPSRGARQRRRRNNAKRNPVMPRWLGANRQNSMSGDLKFQLRLTLRDEFAPVARNDPGDPSMSALTDILHRHHAVMKCQFDAFADYVSEAEANGVQNYHRRPCQEGKIPNIVHALCRRPGGLREGPSGCAGGRAQAAGRRSDRREDVQIRYRSRPQPTASAQGLAQNYCARCLMANCARPVWNHCGLMPANLITLVHLSMFSAMNLANSSGEFGATATAPRSANRCLMFGSSTAALVCWLSVAMISPGVPLGTPKPIQPAAS